MEMLGFVPGIFFMVNSGEFLVKVVEGMLVWALAVADPCLRMHPQARGSIWFGILQLRAIGAPQEVVDKPHASRLFLKSGGLRGSLSEWLFSLGS